MLRSTRRHGIHKGRDRGGTTGDGGGCTPSRNGYSLPAGLRFDVLHAGPRPGPRPGRGRRQKRGLRSGICQRGQLNEQARAGCHAVFRSAVAGQRLHKCCEYFSRSLRRVQSLC